MTTYGILKQDETVFLGQKWDTLILDEAQTIKNPDTQVARLAHAIAADFRICLTGTPIENHVGELWSIYRCALPGLLGSREEFEQRWADPLRAGSSKALSDLRNQIRPFFLRRLKSEVAKELPERQEVTLTCELSDEEQRYYQALLLSSRAKVIASLAGSDSLTASKNEPSSGIMQALELLLRLRQASCHPALGPSPPPQFGRGEHSAKTRILIDSLKEATETGHRSLVFSQWTRFLDLLEPLLEKEGITFDRLDGSTRDRPGVVARFQQDSGPSVLLLSLKAGGTGLTLTAADHVYLLDPWWNPAVEAQAADRAHRLGQTRKVLIHRLISSGTVEEKIGLLQSQKKRLADALLSEETPQTIALDAALHEGIQPEGPGAFRPDTFKAELLALIQAL